LRWINIMFCRCCMFQNSNWAAEMSLSFKVEKKKKVSRLESIFYLPHILWRSPETCTIGMEGIHMKALGEIYSGFHKHWGIWHEIHKASECSFCGYLESHWAFFERYESLFALSSHQNNLRAPIICEPLQLKRHNTHWPQISNEKLQWSKAAQNWDQWCAFVNIAIKNNYTI